MPTTRPTLAPRLAPRPEGSGPPVSRTVSRTLARPGAGSGARAGQAGRRPASRGDALLRGYQWAARSFCLGPATTVLGNGRTELRGRRRPTEETRELREPRWLAKPTEPAPARASNRYFSQALQLCYRHRGWGAGSIRTHGRTDSPERTRSRGGKHASGRWTRQSSCSGWRAGGSGSSTLSLRGARTGGFPGACCSRWAPRQARAWRSAPLSVPAPKCSWFGRSALLGVLSSTGVCWEEFAIICCSCFRSHGGTQTGDICSV